LSPAVNDPGTAIDEKKLQGKLDEWNAEIDKLKAMADSAELTHWKAALTMSGTR
jgi:hypothetical protein